MNSWLRSRFSDPKSSFATVMAIASVTGMLCCLGVIVIVVLTR